MEVSNLLLNEIFVVKEIDMVPTKINNVLIKIKNKIFSKVSRILANSFSEDVDLLLDVNTEIYGITETDKLEFYITYSSISDEKINNEENSLNKTISSIFSISEKIIDYYEYVMYGTIYHSGKSGKNFFIYASFGGLLLKVFGKDEKIQKKMDSIKIDSKILLCIRKK